MMVALAQWSEEWIGAAHLIECARYHARLTEEACARYRRANPDACSKCDMPRKLRRPNKVWTREALVKALRDLAAAEGPGTNLTDFKDEYGVSPQQIGREFGSWRALCEAAGVPVNRPGAKKKDVKYALSASGRVGLDFGGFEELWSDLAEKARQNGITPQDQIMRILKGWFE